MNETKRLCEIAYLQGQVEMLLQQIEEHQKKVEILKNRMENLEWHDWLDSIFSEEKI